MRHNVLVVGPIRITREERADGTVLRVFVADGRQALKIDAVTSSPHYHIDQDRRDIVLPIKTRPPLRWAAQAISENLSELLREAGYEHAAAEVWHEAVQAKLKQLGAALAP